MTEQQRQELSRLWQEALDLPDAPADQESTFTDLGGDSISATLLLSGIKDLWRIGLPIDALFDDMTLPKLAELLARRLAEDTLDNAPSLPPITRQPRDHALPLSHSQRRMWLVQSFAPDTTAYNVTYALRLHGPLDTAALARAVNEVWARHDTFRTRFELGDDGQIRQRVAATPQPVALHAQDLRTLPPEQREDAAHAHLERAARMPLDLVGGPLWHVHLVTLGDGEHVLAWIAHHILVDLWANQVLAREIAHAYSLITSGQAQDHAPPPQALDCADHGHWQNTREFDAHIQPQLDHWQHRLAGLAPTNLATDHPMSPDWYRGARRITHVLPSAWAARLQRFASDQGCSPFMVLLAALAVLMGRQARHDDVGILTPIANRHHPDTAHLVASLVNTLVMRIDLGGLPSGRQLLDRVKQTALDAFRHQDLPFDILVEQMGNASRGHQDLPLGLQVMLNVANAPSEGISFSGLDAGRIGFNRGATQLPLTFIVDLVQIGTVVLEYAGSLFEPDTAEALVSHYIQLVDQLIDQPDQPLSALRWLSPATQDTLSRWNRTQADTPIRQVDALLRAGAAQAPDQAACILGDHSLTHRQLIERAQAVASGLASRGLGPGQRVGVHLPRGLDLLVAVRAVIMSGAAYVPLDPRYPADRLSDMALDAGLGLVIGPALHEGNRDDGASPGFDAGGVPVATLQALAASPVDEAHLQRRAASPDDPLYLIYTSGSTGKPKGVVVPHRTVANFLHSMAREPGIGWQDRLLAVTTLSFDIAVLELLLPLSVGACIVMADEDEVMDGRALASLLQRHRITVMQATPSTWRAMLDSGWQGHAGLKALIGGEALRPELASRLLPCCAELWNMYGPTETTVWSTCWRVAPDAEVIRIGRPIANTRVRIVDAFGHTCPIGAPGEIIIEGDGVADGYWQRPALTADRFIVDETGRPSAYRTGDLGRWCHDGQLEHLGRLDHQIKVRGHRIEPGDIEHALMQHPQIAQAVVVAHEKSAGDVRLVAYVVKKADAIADEQAPAWRAFLRQHLPEHMVPQHLVTLDAMPLLANGKLDRRALPQPAVDLAAPVQVGAAQEPAWTPWEARLAEAWRELLGAQELRPEDNFFDLGGHSLLAMQVIEHLARTTGVKVSPRRYIFETLAQLAASYEREEAASVQAMQPQRHGGPGKAPTPDASPSATHDGTEGLGGKVKRWLKALAN